MILRQNTMYNKYYILWTKISVVILFLLFAMLSTSDPQNKTADNVKDMNITSRITTQKEEYETNIKLLLEALHRKEMEIAKERTTNGLLKAENNQLKKEIKLLKDSIEAINFERMKDIIGALYNMGCAYRGAGEYKKAESCFLEVLKLNPEDADAHYNLAVLYDEDLNNKAAAEKHYKIFLKIAPDDTDAKQAIEWLNSSK